MTAVAPDWRPFMPHVVSIAHEEVADLDMLADDVDGPAELEETLREAFREIRTYHWLRRREGHNQNGYIAHLAGSDACLALGHRNPEHHVDDYATPEAFDAAHDAYDEGHPWGWYDQLCDATRYGTACTECEDETCEYSKVGDLWHAARVHAPEVAA